MFFYMTSCIILFAYLSKAPKQMCSPFSHYEYIKGGTTMRCGATCFVVEYEVHGERKKEYITTRTSAEARKVLRQQTNGLATAITVRRKK